MQLLFKYATKFTSDTCTNPALKGIYFDGDSAYVSDGHVLLILKDQPSIKKLIDPVTGALIDMPYMDCQRVIPKKFQAEIYIQYSDLAKWVSQSKIFCNLLKGSRDLPAICLCCNAKDLKAHVKDREGSFQYTCLLPASRLENKDLKIKMLLNPSYLYHAMSFFKELKAGTVKMQFSDAASNPILVLESGPAMIIIAPYNINRCVVYNDVAD